LLKIYIRIWHSYPSLIIIPLRSMRTLISIFLNDLDSAIAELLAHKVLKGSS
jgi:hypothetical protein